MTQNSNEPKWLGAFLTWVRTEAHKVFGPLSPILLAAASLVGGDFPGARWTLFVLGTLLAILAFILIPRKPSYRKLDKDYRSLSNVQDKHKGSWNDPSDRVSAYYYHAGRFIMIARHSRNPQFREEGRRTYPNTQGLIGKCWRNNHGEATNTGLPADRNKWFEKMTRDGIPQAEAENLTIQSRSMVAVRVEDRSGAVGVQVIESLLSDKVGVQTVARIRESLVFSAVSEFIGGSASETPIAVSSGAGQPYSLYDEDWKPASSIVGGLDLL